jgi:predicted nucleic acid-binding Zn ribbon protein
MIKEEFCPVCIAAVPLAFSMTAGTTNMVIEEEDCEKRKKNNFRLKMYVIIGILSLSVMIYYTFIKKCDECF